MMQSDLPSAGRKPRPIIWRNNPIFRVGRARTMQPMSGQSKPSVSTMQLVTTSVSPDARRARMSSRSSVGVVPSRCWARTPDFTNSSRMWTL